MKANVRTKNDINMKLSEQEVILHSANATILAIFENKDRVPITDGLLMMASYIQFVFPKEADIDMDYTKYALDLSIFKTIKWDKVKTDEDEGDEIAFYRRIRNSIAHANIDFLPDDNIQFFDGPPAKPFKENFRVQVNKFDFGNKFLKEIMNKWMESKFKQNG